MVATKPGFRIYFEKVQELMQRLEEEEFGRDFALFLHFEMHLTLPKILRITQAASKAYVRADNRYVGKALLRDPWRKDLVVYVPRLAPPRVHIEKIVKQIHEQLGVDCNEDGRVAFTSFADTFESLVSQDQGRGSMPPITEFQTRPVPVVISFDATGFGSTQINTVALRNPYLSASNQQLRIFGLGCVNDNRDGTSKVFVPNLQIINDTIRGKRSGVCVDCGGTIVKPKIYICTDIAALRHCEHIAGSGWCGCSSDFALRTTLTTKKPRTVGELKEFLLMCKSPTMEERFIKSHTPLPNESVPRPCPCCQFGHGSPTEAEAELQTLLKEEQCLASDETKA